MLMSYFLSMLCQLEIHVRVEGEQAVLTFRKRRVAVRLKIIDDQNQEVSNMATTISADKKRTFKISAVDNKGRPAHVDGIPVWEVQPLGGVSLFPSSDGMECEVVWSSAAKGQILTITADADLGEGVKPIMGTVDLETLAPGAFGFSVEAGEEVDA